MAILFPDVRSPKALGSKVKTLICMLFLYKFCCFVPEAQSKFKNKMKPSIQPTVLQVHSTQLKKKKKQHASESGIKIKLNVLKIYTHNTVTSQ